MAIILWLLVLQYVVLLVLESVRSFTLVLLEAQQEFVVPFGMSLILLLLRRALIGAVGVDLLGTRRHYRVVVDHFLRDQTQH